MKKAILSRSSGPIVINGIQGVLAPQEGNGYLIVDVGDNNEISPELIGLELAGLIKIVNIDQIPKTKEIVDSPKTQVVVEEGDEDEGENEDEDLDEEDPEDDVEPNVNDADNSEVTIMTENGVKKGRMSFSVVGESIQALEAEAAEIKAAAKTKSPRKSKGPKSPQLLDLDKY